MESKLVVQILQLPLVKYCSYKIISLKAQNFSIKLRVTKIILLISETNTSEIKEPFFSDPEKFLYCT